MSTSRYMTLNASKPRHGSRIFSCLLAGATAVTAGTVGDE